MKRLVIWLSVVLVGCCTMVMPRRIEERRDLITTLKNSTVALVARHNTIDHTYALFCTGVWISKRYIITAKHCIPPSDPELTKLVDSGMPVDLVNVDLKYSTRSDYKQITSGDINVRIGRTIAIDEYQDLALIEADSNNLPDHDTAIIASSGPRDGDSVHIVGHTMGMSWTYLRGYVSATRSPIFDVNGNATKAIQIASPAYMGNSGGGAFNESGELVGISSWISLLSPEMGFFLHIDEVKAFLRRNRIF